MCKIKGHLLKMNLETDKNEKSFDVKNQNSK